ncbi:MAG: BMP family lipoprotein [Vulcanimicrobiaceae bacterium]
MSARRARATLSLALVLGFAALVAGCGGGSSKAGSAASPPALRLALVSRVGSLGERDSAYAGLLAAQRHLGASIAVFDSKTPSDYASNLALLADEDYDQIFAVGYPLGPDLDRIARGYPKRHFAIVDAIVDQPNVVSVVFREQDGAFLAGSLAALMSKSKTIAFLGDVASPLSQKYETGFAAGARQIGLRVRVLDDYTGSPQDAAAGKRLAAALFDKGADVVFVAAGKAGLGAFDEVRARKGDYLIGSGTDQDALVPGKVLTSMLKRVDTVVFTLAQESLAQKTPSGTLSFGLAEGGVGLTDFRYTKGIVGAAKLARLAALERAVADGGIEPPQNRTELAAFKPVSF